MGCAPKTRQIPSQNGFEPAKWKDPGGGVLFPGTWRARRKIGARGPKLAQISCGCLEEVIQRRSPSSGGLAGYEWGEGGEGGKGGGGGEGGKGWRGGRGLGALGV